MGKSLSKKSSDSKSVKRVGSGGVVLPRQHTRLLKERVEHISDFVSLPSEEDETVLGVGVNGEVILGSDKKTGRAVALKIVSKQTKHLDELRLEIDLLSQMDHPNIVKLVASYEDKVNLYMVTEFCPGGDLSTRLASKRKKRFREWEAKCLVVQMCRAIAYVHSHGICHRDLKLNNWLYSFPLKKFESAKGAIKRARSFNSENEDMPQHTCVKLIDFGLSQKYYDMAQKEFCEMKSFVGTPGYVAPEIQQTLHHHIDHYDKAVDMWSMGVLAFNLLSGKMPFLHPSGGVNVAALLSDKIDRSYRSKFQNDSFWRNKASLESRDFIDKLLDPSPQSRLTAQEALAHPWLEVGGFKHGEGLGDDDVHLDNQTLERFRLFCTMSATEQAMMTLVAEAMPPADEVVLRELFLSIDSNNNGVISWEEMEAVLLNSDADSQTVRQIHTLFQETSVDMCEKNSVVYTEFLAATMDHRFLHDKRLLHQSFRNADVGNSGIVDVTELISAFSKISTPKRNDGGGIRGGQSCGLSADQQQSGTPAEGGAGLAAKVIRTINFDDFVEFCNKLDTQQQPHQK